MIGIVAINNKKCIGDKGKLPWRFSEDLKFFKQTTLNSTVIMGRKTFESLPAPLHSRKNVVITNQNILNQNIFSTNYENYKKTIENLPSPYFIIGGKQIYNLFIKEINYFYVTHINNDFEGDTYMEESFFNEFNKVEFFKKLSSNCDVFLYKR